MVNANSKGDRRERELVNLLDERGFAVMRAPASGSATDREAALVEQIDEFALATVPLRVRVDHLSGFGRRGA